jgi:hypothetical protein
MRGGDFESYEEVFACVAVYQFLFRVAGYEMNENKRTGLRGRGMRMNDKEKDRAETKDKEKERER